MPRLSGEVRPVIPSSAPMSYRLDNEVYTLDGWNTDKHVPMVICLGGIALAAYLLLKKSK